MLEKGPDDQLWGLMFWASLQFILWITQLVIVFIFLVMTTAAKQAAQFAL